MESTRFRHLSKLDFAAIILALVVEPFLVGGYNPSEKYANVKLDHATPNGGNSRLRKKLPNQNLETNRRTRRTRRDPSWLRSFKRPNQKPPSHIV